MEAGAEQPTQYPTRNDPPPAYTPTSGYAQPAAENESNRALMKSTSVVSRPGGWRKVSKVQAAEPPSIKDAEDGDDDVRCGLPGCHPPCLQPCASIGGYMLLYSCVAIIQGAFFTYFIAVISTIEKRFGIRSRTTGFVMSGNEVSQIMLSIILNYYGGKGHRPRWLAGGMVCVVLCSVILAMPHFILGPGELYKPDEAVSKIGPSDNFSLSLAADGFSPKRNMKGEMFKRSLCKAKHDKSTDLNFTDGFAKVVDHSDCTEDYEAKVGMALIFLAHFVSGIGLCLFYPLSWSFYDDNVHPKHAPFFHGFSSAVRVIGPFFGFILAYGCLQVYVVPTKDPGLSPHDPRWLGAWWLGFVAVGAALLVFAGFMACFPRRIPTKYSNAEAVKKKLEKQKSEENGTSVVAGLKDIPQVLKRLVKNKIYMFHLTAVCFHVFGYIGFFSFSPKYLEAQFRVTAAKSSMGSGVAGVLVQVFGMLGSGYVVRKYKPRAQYATSYGVLVSAISVAGFILSMFIGCPNLNMQGQVDSNGRLALTSPCNEECHCPMSFYDPVCAEGGQVHFFSPCHAGCQSIAHTGDLSTYRNKTIYGDCMCIRKEVDVGGEKTLQVGSATHGFCDADSTTCNTFLTYLIVLGFVKFISSTGRVVGLMITMRCVDKKDKPVALACMVTAISLFASIPSPILYGAIIDSTCLVWKTSKCGSQGNCAFYDGDRFRFSLHAWTASFIVCALFFEIPIVLRSKELDLYGEEEDKKKDNNELGEIPLDDVADL